MWRKEERFTKKGRETDGILFAFLVCSKYCSLQWIWPAFCTTFPKHFQLVIPSEVHSNNIEERQKLSPRVGNTFYKACRTLMALLWLCCCLRSEQGVINTILLMRPAEKTSTCGSPKPESLPVYNLLFRVLLPIVIVCVCVCVGVYPYVSQQGLESFKK